jgi:hypothetical protein
MQPSLAILHIVAEAFPGEADIKDESDDYTTASP